MNTNISPPIRAGFRDRKGGTLIGLIAVILIIGVMGVSVITFTHSTEHSFLIASAGSRAYYLAESGLRYAQQIHCDSMPAGWLHGRSQTLTLHGGEVVVIRLVDTFWATAVVDAGTAQEARAEVPMPVSLCGVDPAANPADEFAVFGDTAISLGNNTVIQGDVAITGDDVELKGDVIGNILANDISTHASSSTTVTGSIFSSGTVSIGTGTVTGDIHAATGIILSSAQSSVPFGGWLFSNGNIELSGGSVVLGHVHTCGGNVETSGSAVIGTALEPIEVHASGNVSLGGGDVYGDVYAGGNIVVSGSARIVGNAYAGGTITGTVTGTSMPNSPTYLPEPICPDLTDLDDLNLPDATVFTAGEDDVDVPAGGSPELPTEFPLAPGSYNVLSSPNNVSDTRLFLNDGSDNHGNYYFNSISLGNFMHLYLDLSGGYDIRIFVVGDIDFGRDLNVFVSTDGTNYTEMSSLNEIEKEALGARVYWESATSDYTLGQSSNWFGTVYTPVGSLSTSNAYLIGSYFSGGGHNLQNSTVFHVAPNYFAE